MNTVISRRLLARTVATRLLEEPGNRQQWVKALAAYLVEHHRVAELDLVVNDIAHELFEQRGELVVDVASARPLTDHARGELKSLLKQATGAKHVSMSERRDPALLGGLVARTPDAQLDASVRTTLQQLATIT